MKNISSILSNVWRKFLKNDKKVKSVTKTKKIKKRFVTSMEYNFVARRCSSSSPAPLLEETNEL